MPSRPNLEKLIIQVPSIQKQNQITKLEQNVNQRQKLLQRKIEIINNISQKSLITILN